MLLVDDQISIEELTHMMKNSFGFLVKAVVDLEKQIMVVDAPLHADQEAVLLEQGSKQSNLWGINLYPEKYGSSEFIEYDSMINLRPQANNLSRGVDDEKVRQQIYDVVIKLVKNQ